MPSHALMYLRTLLWGASVDCYLEVRYRRRCGMSQLFFGVGQVHDAARVIDGLGTRTDVYVGVVPRTIPTGHRAAVRDGRVAWADCDEASSVERVQRFEPAPSVLVRSGSPAACHAYWMLTRAMPVAGIEQLNRRLAAALGADTHAVDAARVLRPPGTRNFKHAPPTPVELVRHTEQRVDARCLEEALPYLSPPTGSPRLLRADGREDPLLAIAPAEYVATLLGVQVDRARKIRCPFHDDRTPSLHVYNEPERGWHCFGCGRGGSIYDFAAQLWFFGQSPEVLLRGERFIEVRERLMAMFFPADAG